MKMPTQNKILSRRDAAARLGLSERTLDRLCATKSGLRKIQLSTRRVGVAEDEIDAYISRAVGQSKAA
jgi:predicted DNA-binding transcriptional regulator AlpA